MVKEHVESFTRHQPELDKCGHANLSDFKVDTQWRCCGCGHVSHWGKTWKQFGSHGCLKCKREPAVEAVTCSDACVSVYEYAKRLHGLK